jgi:allophanate hydrolase subunit 1
MPAGNEWPTTQQLYDMIVEANAQTQEKIDEFTKSFNVLQVELVRTQETVKRYNNLVAKMEKVELKVEDHTNRLNAVENQSKGKKDAGESVQKWVPWAITIVLFLDRVITFIVNLLKGGIVR